MRITADLGELIRSLREARGIARSELAEQSGVSISHLEKIEAGQRSPGMNTFLKMMLVLDVNISLSGTGNTIQEKCVVAVQDIILGCAEGEAEYLACMVECMARNFTLMA